MPKLVWFNGEISPLETAKVPADDHAHLYGDGLFEGIRFYSRKVFRLDPHLDRLYRGMNFLGFNTPMPQAAMKALILDVCRQADLEDGYIRLNVTRGSGLGLDPKHIKPECNVMVMVNTISLYPKEKYESGMKVMTSPVRTIPPDSLDPRLKCIGRYAANILAKQYANRIGADDAMMLNQQGYVAEGTGNNIFLVQGRVLRTPHPSCGILNGITRGVAMELAQEAGLSVREEFLTPYDVLDADEAFFTGTATEIIPMVALDGNPVGCGQPGPITRFLMDRFREATAEGDAF